MPYTDEEIARLLQEHPEIILYVHGRRVSRWPEFAEFIREHPEMILREIAKELKCSVDTVQLVIKEYKIPRGRRARGEAMRKAWAQIVQLAQDHPEMPHKEIGKRVGYCTARVNEILRQHGIHVGYGGRNMPWRRPGMSDEQYEWELILKKEGLGMGRGAAGTNGLSYVADLENPNYNRD